MLTIINGMIEFLFLAQLARNPLRAAGESASTSATRAGFSWSVMMKPAAV